MKTILVLAIVTLIQTQPYVKATTGFRDESTDQTWTVMDDDGQLWSFERVQEKLVKTMKDLQIYELEMKAKMEQMSQKIKYLELRDEHQSNELQGYVAVFAHSTQYKLDFIREMTRSAWNAYVKYAWPHDSLAPQTETRNLDMFGYFSGRSIVAAMSTLWVMGLEEEFNRGKQWIAAEFDFTGILADGLLFNEVAEYVGGLLSCYALTGDELFLRKAEKVAKHLRSAYKTKTGLPYRTFNPNTEERFGDWSYLSEIGGQYLEHVYLSDVTANPLFKNEVTRIRNQLKEVAQVDGHYLHLVNINGSRSTGQTTTASLFEYGRDFYRNLIKSYIQSGGRNEQALQYYIEAMEAIDDAAVFETADNGAVFARTVGHLFRFYQGTTMNYSGCYLGAMLSMGAKAMRKKSLSLKLLRHQELAMKLTETCYQESARTTTKLGPTEFFPGRSGDGPFLLSSELAESYFILWRQSGDEKYREYAWEMAQAINRHCRTAIGGFSGLNSTMNIAAGLTDHQPAEFLSGTLKYLYLTFAEDDLLSLDQWVFNSVGHPLPICGKHHRYPAKLCKN